MDRESPELARILAANAAFGTAPTSASSSPTPTRRLAVLTCMDARIHVEALLELVRGDAHIVRNAGGLATDDAIRSLVISHQLLGTAQILVIEHTGCGLLGLDDGAVRRDLTAATGRDADVVFLGFDDLEANLRLQVDRIRAHPWLAGVPVHGLIYEVESGRLRAAG